MDSTHSVPAPPRQWQSFSLLLVAAVLVRSASAHASYKSKVPNGDQFRYVGHRNGYGPPQNNQFGLDFAASGFRWTPGLCSTDSDGDGVTNGAELGDPDCTWQEGGTPSCTTNPSHPGDSADAGDCGTGSLAVDMDKSMSRHRVHGLLMSVAWLLVAPLLGLATIARRLFIFREFALKEAGCTAQELEWQAFNGRWGMRLMNAHKFGMALVAVLTVVGAVLALIAHNHEGHDHRRRLDDGGSSGEGHKVLGYVTGALVFVQPLIWLYMRYEMRRGASAIKQDGPPPHPTWAPSLARYAHRGLGFVGLFVALFTVSRGRERFSYLYPTEDTGTVDAVTAAISIVDAALLLLMLLMTFGATRLLLSPKGGDGGDGVVVGVSHAE